MRSQSDIQLHPAAAGSSRKPRSRRGRRASRLTAALCWLYALTILGLFVSMRVSGERWWIATVLLFSPRWVWMAPLGLIIPMVFLFRRRMAIPAMVGALIVLFGIMDFRVPWRTMLPSPATHETLRVFTCNIHSTQSDLALLNTLVNQANPDIILLQDFTRDRAPQLSKEKGWYTNQVDEMFVASRYPLRRVESLLPRDQRAEEYAQHGVPNGKAECYEVQLPGGTFHIVNLHLASPHRPLDKIRANPRIGGLPIEANSARRGEESVKIHQRVQQIGGSFILAGDFNTPDDSPIFRQAWASYWDAFSVAGLGFGTTYAKHCTWLRIDHILADSTWTCTDCKVGPDIGSGHRPVFAEFKR